MSLDNVQVVEASQSVNLFDKTAKKILIKLLSHLKQSQLTIVDLEETISLGENSAPLKAVVHITNPKTYKRILLGGSIAAGESYIDGWWTSPDLTKVIQVLGREQGVLDGLEKSFTKALSLPKWIYHKARKNTKEGSKKNILAHYDLGNDMYKTFLDKEMMYSSAIYPHQDATLDEAQLHKLKTICERLELKPGETLLEIGSGWGALAIYAAQHYGVYVTTTTISDAQFAYAKARVDALGLNDKITLLSKDYRELEGQYDKLVSIEMIEAVGHEYLGSFFETCNKHLKPEGKMLIQAITISDQRYHQYRKGVDFIQRYIFPGGCLPSINIMADNVTNKTDMVITGLHDIGQDYAKTLKHWFERFDTQLSDIKKMGYGDDFIRLWQFYLCYCEGAFLERTISTVHLIAAKPGYRND
ncbi:SAM-dependent methyltransferase [Psychromonas antarctica]|uniref:SAM-dependent methyltransferase n=1 Tax=Psychromonas antarctica TaxID=67573 RepID=UPI001EE901E8|nr:cyclopropane-fatty-acyl-phospholipid synthase family protein [Psychromonas antarctica]MCG6202074.1 cyclopropane-fatty-acyl-phospholipid synthase family protein [Psychromonas antarctica]